MPFDASGTFTRIRGADSWKGDATSGTPIRADLHDTNDNDFASGLSDCITKNGKTQPTADLPMAGKRLINLGAPTASTDAVNKAYVDAAIEAAKAALQFPVGTMVTFSKAGAATIPTGWLYCNGQAISRAAYSALFALIGTQFGTGDGASTFNLPDLRGQFLRGWADDQTILDSGRAFGSKQDELIKSHVHPATSGINSVGHTHGVAGATSSIGDHAHTTALYGFSTVVVTDGVPASGMRSDAGSVAYGSSAAGAHNHSFSVTSGGQSANHTHAITVDNNTGGGAETRPANIALIWIIKT